MFPLGVADARVSGWPVVTFAVAGASVLLTALVWLAPDAEVDRAQANVRAYASEHPAEMPPEGCLPHLGGLAQGELARTPATAEFERRCNTATEASHVGQHKRFALQPPGRKTPDLAWVLHPFVWTNLLGALTGLLLLVLVVGSFVEDRYGRGRYAAALAGSAAVSALVWRLAAGDASDGWSGGQGYLAALLALFVATFATRPVKFLVLTPLPKMIDVPAWAVAVWWLVARMLSLWLGEVDRPLVVAELISFVAGCLAGVALRLRVAERPAPAASRATPAAPTAGRSTLDGGRHSAPPARAGQAAVAAPDADPGADLPPVAPTAPAPDAAWAVAGPDPLAEPQIALRKRPPSQDAPPASASSPVLATLPATAQPPEAPHAPMVFDFSVPAAVEFAGQGTGFSSPLALAVAPPANSHTGSAPDALDLLLPPDAFDLDAFVAGLPPPPAVEPDTDLIAPPAAARQPHAPPPLAAQPSPYEEATKAYLPGHLASHLQLAEPQLDPAVPQVQLAARIDRADDGVFLALVGDTWLRLDAPQVRAVAVGLVLHRDHPGAAPEIWIDVVTDPGGRDRPARAVRLHPARDDLARLLPEVAPSRAFAHLAESLAADGAFQLPQQPVWPGPPFPRYDTAAEFIRMWHRQLHG